MAKREKSSTTKSPRASVRSRRSTSSKSAAKTNKKPSLTDFKIKGFRGFENLNVPFLGRVTLVTGKNGAGKTTLLEAIRIYAARGDFARLRSLLMRKNEKIEGIDEDGDEIFVPNYHALFFDGRNLGKHSPISISSTGSEDLKISMKLAGEFPKRADDLDKFPDDFPILEVIFGSSKNYYPLYHPVQSRLPTQYYRWRTRRSIHSHSRAPIVCHFLGPNSLDSEEIATLFDAVALTDEGESAIGLLRHIAPRITNLASVGGSYSRPGRHSDRRILVKMEGSESRVPLESLGDGAMRFLGVALALANAKDGFLLVDEIENGIHYSVQGQFWDFVLRAATELNVQVIAATHGWSSICSFAHEASKNNKAEGILTRIERNKLGETICETYTEEEVFSAAEQGIEMR